MFTAVFACAGTVGRARRAGNLPGVNPQSEEQLTVRTLGLTTLAVSPLGLGLAALGRPGYINLGHARDLNEDYEISSMEARAHRVLDAAWAAGVHYFDAARSYGRSEAFLGSWLRARHIPAGAVTIGSKWGYTYTANWQIEAEHHEVKEHSLAVLQRQWDETFEHLATYLSLYQIHSATLESGVLENRAVLHGLACLKQAGVAVGLSLSGVNQAAVLARALEIKIDGVRLFDTVQATWNLLEPSAGVALQTAAHAGLGVIVKEALANGRLTSRNTQPQFSTKMTQLTRQAERLNCSVDALALAAVLAQPWAGVVLSGAAAVGHLHSNMRALVVPWDDEAATALVVLAESPEIYWQTRQLLAWN